ncbi:MAG: methyl-accepting chemotaxis protein, partial [Anaerolineae bacterium]
MDDSKQKSRQGWRSLSYTLIAIMLALALLPLAAVAGASIYSLSNSIEGLEMALVSTRQEMAEEVVGARLQNEARVTMDRIDAYMQERIRDTVEWARAPLIRQAARDGAGQAEALGLPALTVDEIEEQMDESRALSQEAALAVYLANLSARNPAFTELFFTEAHGYNVAYSNKTSDFVQSGEEWWDAAWVEGSFVGPVQYDESAGVYSIEIAARIEDGGQALGVLKAVLDIQALQSLADNAASRVEDGDVRLFTQEGDQIADTASGHSPTKIMNQEGNLLEQEWEAAESVAAQETGEAGYLLSQADLGGEPVVVGYAASAPGSYFGVEGFDGFSWSIMVQQPEETAFAVLGGVDGLAAEMHATQNSILMMLLVISALAAIVAVAVAVLASRNIVGPLSSLAQASERISAGDFSVPVKVERRNEIGRLAEAFRQMVAYLQEMAEAARRLAEGDVSADVTPRSEEDALGHAFRQMIGYQREMATAADRLAAGDLTADVQPQSEQDRLGSAFWQMITNLRQLIGQVTDNAYGVGSASEQMAAAADQAAQATSQVAATIQQVAQGTSRQVESVMQTTSSVAQMGRAIDGVAQGSQEQAAAVGRSAEITAQISTAVRQVADNAQAGARGSSEAAQVARRGAQTVEDTIRGIEGIRQKVGFSAEKVREMGRRSEEIGAIIETIDDIADKTNLLALNAAIEAARAGEHGKGFAVVATAVGDLAAKSTAATKEIAALVKSVQETVAEAVGAMEEGTAEVDSGVVRANQANEALGSILAATEETNRQMAEIASAAQQMDALANELVGAMDGVSAVVEENTAATE